MRNGVYEVLVVIARRMVDGWKTTVWDIATENNPSYVTMVTVKGKS
jgi:hypothetical protein